MRSRWFPWLILSLCLIAILIARAPARLLLQWVPAEQLVLQGVSGTLWQGQASRALVAMNGDWLHLGNLRWQLSPLSLLTLSPGITLDSEWGRQQLSARVKLHSQQHIEMEAVDAVFDASLLREFLPVALAGSVALQFERLVINAGLPEEAQGRIVWQDAGWLSPQGRRALGSYVLDVSSAQPGVLVGEVITLSGDTSASGPVVLRQRDYQFDVLITGPGLEDPQLRQAIQLVASPQGSGYRVKLEGSL